MFYDNHLSKALETRLLSGRLLILESLLDSTKDSKTFYLLLDEIKQSYEIDTYQISYVGKMVTYSNSSIPYVEWHDPGSIEGCLSFSVKHSQEDSIRAVTIGPTGQVFMIPKDVKGKGLGRFAASLLTNKISHLGGDYKVARGKLSGLDAKTDTERKRRNKFYSGMGLTLDFGGDEEETDGGFYANSVKELTARYPDDKIRLVGGSEMITRHLDAIKESDAKAQEVRSLEIDKADMEKQGKTRRILWIASIAVAFIAGLIF